MTCEQERLPCWLAASVVSSLPLVLQATMGAGGLPLPPAATCRAVALSTTSYRKRRFSAAPTFSSSSSRIAVAAALPTSTPPITRSSSGGENDVSVDWREATSHFFYQDTRPIMLFDGVCNLCNGGVRFVKASDHNRRMRFEALQSDSGRKLLQRSGRSPDDISSVVLVEKDRSYIKSEAVLKIMEYLDLPFPQLALFLRFLPLFIRDVAYDSVANNRYTIFGQSETCEI